MPIDLVNLLKGVELFTGLNQDQLQRLAAITQLKTYQDGTVVFSRGEPGDALYVIGDGQVEVILGESPDSAHVHVYLGQGQIFGEMALIDYGERSATIRCGSSQASIAVIARQDFEQLCASDTAIGYTVMRNIASDLSFKLRHRNMEPKSG
jgi:CRP/FNR family cyclic AMP-dependent transcriptional regulator